MLKTTNKILFMALNLESHSVQVILILQDRKNHMEFYCQHHINKRAMMALDRSPESFSPQMSSASLFLWFKLVTLKVGPVLTPKESYE